MLTLIKSIPRVWRKYWLRFMTMLILCLLLFSTGCTSLTGLYFVPRTVWIQTPQDVGLVYEDVYLTTADDITVHAWWMPAQQDGVLEHNEEQQADAPVVLYLHGNGENISSHFRSIAWLPERGVGVLALDYRGYGASEGHAMMPAVMLDIEAAAIWLKNKAPEQPLVVLGQSMGAALAVNFVAAAQQTYAVKALLLDAPFSGFPAIARSALAHSWIGYLFWPGTLLVPSRWDPVDLAPSIGVPVLVFHSPTDQVIPYQQGRKVYEALSSPSCWFDSRGHHIETFSYDDLRAVAHRFIQAQGCSSFTGD